MKAKHTLALLALLSLAPNPAVLAQDLFLHTTMATPARSMFLLTNDSALLRGWLSVDGVSSGALANDINPGAAYFAQAASESLQVIYVDSNSYASPSLNDFHRDSANVRGQACQFSAPTATEIIPGTPSQFGAVAGDTMAQPRLSDLGGLGLSASTPDSPAGWFTYSLSFTAN